MSNQRIIFRKTGKAIYISHLDLMRTMQRVFIRAGLKIKHTEGFNPHPYMNFALPLSVGTESVCEMMDFELTEPAPLSDIPAMLNASMPAGVEVTEAYEAERKFKEIVWLKVKGELFYDSGVGDDVSEKIEEVFKADSLVITKKTKRGVGDFDVIPCIHELKAEKADNGKVILNATITAQNPALNPVHLITALAKAESELEPDFVKFTRLEVFDAEFKTFR